MDGNYKKTCVNVMEVLRQNKDSLMAVLEAFVHDPLLNWRLIDKGILVSCLFIFNTLIKFTTNMQNHIHVQISVWKSSQILKDWYLGMFRQMLFKFKVQFQFGADKPKFCDGE